MKGAGEVVDLRQKHERKEARISRNTFVTVRRMLKLLGRGQLGKKRICGRNRNFSL